MSMVTQHLQNRTLVLRQPRSLVVGCGCARQCVDELASRGLHRVFLVCVKPIRDQIEPILEAMATQGMAICINDTIKEEPDIARFEAILDQARQQGIDAVVGIGGGSVLDVAKLVAALLNHDQPIQELFGIDHVQGRKTPLICLPTTAGTGSEVSPNAILLDEIENLKKGVVSPHLVPDAAFIDPCLTLSVPPDMTSATGLDALTHCIEAYANRVAHPMIDLYALKGIELISTHLEIAYRHGDNLAAREALAWGSLYGGLCLGPVNTGAVHALAYPLGGEFHIPHGVSNALLLPAVVEFNLPAAPERYARIALAMGCSPGASEFETAQAVVTKLKQLSQRCGNLSSLSQWGVPHQAITRMARSALTVTRLLKNNPRELTQVDAERIYASLLT